MTARTNLANGVPRPEGPSAAHVARDLMRHPYRELVRKWNYKSAVTSAVVRGVVFLVANLSAGLEAALLASAAECLLRLGTAGFYGALTQAFGAIRPARHGTLAAVLGLPVLSHSLEVALHVLRGTPNLVVSLVASLALTIASTVFTLFAMRRGLLVVGVGEAQSLGDDLRAMPALVHEFARAVATTVNRDRPIVTAGALTAGVAARLSSGTPAPGRGTGRSPSRRSRT